MSKTIQIQSRKRPEAKTVIPEEYFDKLKGLGVHKNFKITDKDFKADVQPPADIAGMLDQQPDPALLARLEQLEKDNLLLTEKNKTLVEGAKDETKETASNEDATTTTAKKPTKKNTKA